MFTSEERKMVFGAMNVIKKKGYYCPRNWRIELISLEHRNRKNIIKLDYHVSMMSFGMLYDCSYSEHMSNG